MEKIAKTLALVGLLMFLFGWITYAIFWSDLAGAEAVLSAAQVMGCQADACVAEVMVANREAGNAGAWLTWSMVTMIVGVLI